MEAIADFVNQDDSVTAFINRREDSENLAGAVSHHIDRYALVQAYIDEHFRESTLTASSVAAHFNYSADYLARLFSQAYHETLAAYIGEKRIAYAARLLIETRLSVNDVTAQCGYKSASYFARTFKKRFTLSPSDYRAINAPATKG